MTTASTKKKRPDLVTVIAIYQFLVAAVLFVALLALGLGLLSVLLYTVAEEAIVAGMAIVFFMVVVLILLAINVAAGWGLLALKNWARWLAVILGVLSLWNFPIGTVIGGLKIWYFLTPEAREAFETETYPTVSA